MYIDFPTAGEELHHLFTLWFIMGKGEYLKTLPCVGWALEQNVFREKT